MTGTPAPFDRAAVRAHRARAARHGADGDFLFDEVAARLLDRLDDVRRPFARALDLGCRRGGLGARLTTRTTEGGTVVQCDLALEMACLARDANGLATVAADEEALPFAPGTFDLIVSNLALHWTNDLPGALVQVRRALAPDGLFLAALFGVGTLAELRGALMAAELEAEGGVGPRVSPFAEVRDGGDLLARAGFALPVADLDTVRVSFESALHLMRDLRRMGEANAVAERRKGFSRRRTLMDAAARYPVDTDGRVTATFEIVFLAGWAPGPDQPKALRPGTATTRLADYLGTQEMPVSDSTGRKRKT
jgi:SAM-dependent methyltransferase